MNILVTGGAGYIGSHTCVALLEAGHEVIVADNLSNSSASVLERIERITGKKVTFYQIDVTVKEAVKALFERHPLDGVIHFAGFKAVAESVARPLDYYYNNVVSTMILAGACLEHGVGRFVFSRRLRYTGRTSLCGDHGTAAGCQSLRPQQGHERAS